MIADDREKATRFRPDVVNPLKEAPRTLLIGAMGGSALAADALDFLGLGYDVTVHRTYDLPSMPDRGALCIAVSYSGNTEETLSFANAALAHGYPLAVVTSGGALATLAHEHQLPLSLVPPGFAPRHALLYMVRSLLALLGEQPMLDELANAPGTTLALSEPLTGTIPLFYTSMKNAFIGRMGKLLMNETARLPSFTNVFPELNHNEMQAFDSDMPQALAPFFRFMLVEDSLDDPRIQARMSAFTKVMEARGRTVLRFILPVARSTALLAAWNSLEDSAREVGMSANIDPNGSPLIEEFKKLL